MPAVQTIDVIEDENGQRLDRWLRKRFPGLTQGRLEKLLRTGQVRVDGGRAKANSRLEAGQKVRIPPLPDEALKAPSKAEAAVPTKRERQKLEDSVLYEDEDVLVVNKPAGLATQGGTGISRHLDGFLRAIYGEKQRPKLVHRLDKDTSGVLVLARNDFAAAKLSESFRGRDTRKYYWALVSGTPKPKQGKISLALNKGKEGKMFPDEEEGKRAVTLYQVVENAMRASFVALWPLTGRTHQLRVHMQQIGTPILGDPLYSSEENELSGEISVKRLHLHARRLIIPHPRPKKGRKVIDVTAPLPADLKQSWKFFEFPEDDGDPFASYGDEIK
ncbi:MAG TPA: RluA family pseudouridine synthase [Alphaproteobacteria bacterium]|nr:RluA family pseudouridine synthase [Alphaproteobacteria bacterium]